jgi:type I restriction enzyme S subunit
MKDSGIEWLGEIPAHWSYSSLKWFSKIYSGGTPSKDIEEYWIDGTIPWLNSGCVNQWDITEVSDYITEDAFNNSSAKWIPNQSLVIALAGQGKTKGMVAQVKFETTCNQSLGVIVPNEKINNRFLQYWLKNNYQNIRSLGGGDKRDGLNLVMIGGIPIPVLSLIEQEKIAKYLDSKNIELDSVKAKTQQEIELLKEYKTALISEVVTGKVDVRNEK